MSFKVFRSSTVFVNRKPLRNVKKYRCLFSSVPGESGIGSKEDDMPGIDFNVLRQEISIEQVLDLLGFEPVTRTGAQLHGPCPVHGSTSARSRSFSVNLELGRYHCHQCGSQGNPLELWAAVQKTSLYVASQDLCVTLGRDVPWINSW